MNVDSVVAIANEALYLIIITSAPVLLVSLVVGLIISIFQTVTSIQEQTLTFVPKIIAVFVALMIVGQWMLTKIIDFMTSLWSNFSLYIDEFERGMEYSYALFGEYAFRKICGQDFRSKKRTQINKLLMLTITVLLVKYSKDYWPAIERGTKLSDHLAELTYIDQHFFNAITWSTNSKGNFEYVFKTLKTQLFDKYLL